MNTEDTGDWYEDPLETLRQAGPGICDDKTLAVEIFQALTPVQLLAACTLHPELVERFDQVVAQFVGAGWAFDEDAIATLGQLVAADRQRACSSVLEELCRPARP